MQKIWLLLPLMALLLASPVQAEDARAIMQSVIDRNDGDTHYDKQIIATCKYTLKGGKLRCSERPRIKMMEVLGKDDGANGKDHKSVMIILKPAAEKGIAFLQYDYDDQSKDSDQWMYLSALGKVKRIVSGNGNEPRKGALFGSEFGYEDIEKAHLDSFTYKLLRQEQYQQRDCWVIEVVPTAAQARKSNYSRFEQWIDKERLIVLKNRLFDRGGKLKKQLTASDVRQVDGIWVAHKANMNNVQEKRVSTLKIKSLTLNLPVQDELLSQRILHDAAFRERKLTKFRATFDQ